MSAANVTPIQGAPIAAVQIPAGFEDVPAVMSPKTLAALLEVTPKSLERWRDAGTGPAVHKLPGSSLIRYTRDDVIAWLASCREEAAS